MRYDVITFDCYGTLIDWNEGIVSAFTQEADRCGRTLDRDAVLSAYHHAEADVEASEYRSYREVLQETALRTARVLGWPALERPGMLADALPSWKPFSDTNDALRRLQRAGCSLAILSNVDDDLLEATLRHLDVDFDFCITAQQVRSYKPASPHFLTARSRIGARRWLHAAQSYYHDIVPAVALGISSAWINRSGEPVETVHPEIEFTNLRALADWVI